MERAARTVDPEIDGPDVHEASARRPTLAWPHPRRLSETSETIELKITSFRKRAALIGKDQYVVAKHDQKVTDLFAVAFATRLLIAEDARIAPQREERMFAPTLQVALSRGHTFGARYDRKSRLRIGDHGPIRAPAIVSVEILRRLSAKRTSMMAYRATPK
jgi:hypothetical protein